MRGAWLEIVNTSLSFAPKEYQVGCDGNLRPLSR